MLNKWNEYTDELATRLTEQIKRKQKQNEQSDRKSDKKKIVEAKQCIRRWLLHNKQRQNTDLVPRLISEGVIPCPLTEKYLVAKDFDMVKDVMEI